MEVIKDNTKRGKNIILAFIVAAGIDILSILIIFYQNSILPAYDLGEVSGEKIELLDYIVSASGIAQFISNVVIIILFLSWFRRAYGNLIRLKYNQLEYTETSVVWGFFIPLISLVRPIKTAKEIYIYTQRAIKHNNDSYQIKNGVSFIPLWWIAYIINGMIGNYTSKVYDKANTIQLYIEANNIYMFSDVCNIIAICLALFMINKITKLESLFNEVYYSRTAVDEIGILED